MPVLTEERSKRITPPPVPPDDGGDNGGSSDFGSSFPISKGQLAVWILLTAIVMLFAGLSSAYIVLRGVPAWQNIDCLYLLGQIPRFCCLAGLPSVYCRAPFGPMVIQSLNRWLPGVGVL